MAVAEVTGKTFEAEVLQADRWVVVDFWADWCTPCLMLTPILKELAEERKDIKICKINVDGAQDIAGKYEVMSLPHIILFKDGERSTCSPSCQSRSEQNPQGVPHVVRHPFYHTPSV